ncbi:YaeQ family protein [Pontibacterium sp. N1Y112]|uniref:YaeQ family protein n=2 Tax=Pontibacterium sinense TaxID=2781979 RepID=A0A8J7FW39_9GAMM|nr:YaeQ family protein [Pontibacterium sinense]
MALKPTIYKVDLNLVDMDRNNYQQCKLTLALHPSETPERMMVRLLVYGLNQDQDLVFSRGISATDEPDLWIIRPDGSVDHWIELGQASTDRIRKGISRAPEVTLYAYGSETDIWWEKNKESLQALPKLSIYRFNWDEVEQLAAMVNRNMELTLTISDGDLFLADDQHQVSLTVRQLS